MLQSHGLRAAAGAPGITFIGSATGAASATTVTVNKPTGTLENHLMVAFLCSDAGTARTWTPPSGWTEALDQAAAPNITVCYKVAGASEGASYTWTISGGGPNLFGVIATYSGATWDTVGSVTTGSASGVQTASAITLASSASTLFAFFMNTGSSVTWSSPSSGLALLSSDSDANKPSSILYSQNNVGSGSTGTKSATASSSANIFGCVLAAIKPT